jgi:hypothetical protein
MADETTATTYTDRILAELINEQVAAASLARVVALNHCSFDSIAGEPTFAKAYPRFSDLGAASSASAGTDISANTELTMGTQLVLTVSEIAGTKSTILDTAMERKMPGMSGVALVNAIREGNASVLGIFAEEFARHYQMTMEAVEVAVMALLDDFSTSVGTSGVDFDLAQAESAVYQLTNKETGRESDWCFLLAPVQVSDLRRDIAINGGGAGGSVWSTDIQSITSLNPGVEQTGLVGALYGIPVYQTATSTNPSPNTGANEAGALLVSGGGRGPNDRPGALMFLEGDLPKYDIQRDASLRATELVTTYSAAVGERFDDGGISIITDA